MASDALKAVKLRNDFYKDNFRRMAFVLLLSVLLNAILIITTLFLSLHQPKPVYFATTPKGSLIKLVPLNQPNMTSEAITSWVARNVPKIYQLDFMNYRPQILSVRQYFTTYGWGQFLHAFSGVLKKIRDEKLVANASPNGPPIITRNAIIHGVYSWEVQVPMVVTYQKGSTQYIQKVVWSVVVQRVNNVHNNHLLGISQIVQTVQPEQVNN